MNCTEKEGTVAEEDNDTEFETTKSTAKSFKWRHITRESLDLQYATIYGRSEADELLKHCEDELEYNTGQLAKIRIFGKWLDIPRRQVAFGDPGLSYKFSGNSIPAREWTPLLSSIRERIEKVTGHSFNFVLVNRYQNGNDYMGEHRDDEKDLARRAPIASLSLGQQRDFVFKHAEARGKNAKRKIPTLTVTLEHGSLLVINYPTNVHWYHSLPKRKKLPGVRVNMTFRVMKTKNDV